MVVIWNVEVIPNYPSVTYQLDRSKEDSIQGWLLSGRRNLFYAHRWTSHKNGGAHSSGTLGNFFKIFWAV